MIIVLKPGTTEAQAETLMALIRDRGCKPLYLPGEERVVLGAIGDERALVALNLEAYPQVESVKPVLNPHKMVSREFHPHDTVVTIGRVAIGGDRLPVFAGPRAVESAEQIKASADAVAQAGAACLWTSAFTPRINPYGFQGLGAEGLQYLRDVAQQHDMPCIGEIVDCSEIEMVIDYVDALAVDESNMQNSRLLRALGTINRPVLLERGRASCLRDLLLAAEYVAAGGNANIILCERGIRTFETAMEDTLDLSAVPYLKQATHLPVLVDVSRSTRGTDLVLPLAKAAVAAGADGLLVHVHPTPTQAVSGGSQSLDSQQFVELMHGIRPFVTAAGRLL